MRISTLARSCEIASRTAQGGLAKNLRAAAALLKTLDGKGKELTKLQALKVLSRKERKANLLESLTD